MTVSIKKGNALDTLNMTPMIDVVFNLLIFFMVASEFAKEDRQLDVELPEATEAMPLTAKPKEIFVNVDKQGRFFMENRMVTEDEVDAFLQRTSRDNPVNASAIIRADRRVPFDYVVKVMNLCNRAKMRYVVSTEGEK
jgi:biopolymer transport protein ExbD